MSSVACRLQCKCLRNLVQLFHLFLSLFFFCESSLNVNDSTPFSTLIYSLPLSFSLAGRTHNANYALYHIGQPATGGVKQFAETGKTELLDSNAGEQQQQQMQAQARATSAAAAAGAGSAGSAPATAERSVFDEFSLPAIQLGAGRSEAKVFVDSNHSLVSLMTRIVPSPDWFIGVDSFEVRPRKSIAMRLTQHYSFFSGSSAWAAPGLIR